MILGLFKQPRLFSYSDFNTLLFRGNAYAAVRVIYGRKARPNIPHTAF